MTRHSRDRLLRTLYWCAATMVTLAAGALAAEHGAPPLTANAAWVWASAFAGAAVATASGIIDTPNLE
ncbi:MAG: hypothetical protein AAGD35_08655 [Actinomycetota bacterium]